MTKKSCRNIWRRLQRQNSSPCITLPETDGVIFRLVESGGDWDRRNRLKAYNALYKLSIRAYNVAAPLLLDSLSTFTSTELCTYETLVMYAVLAGAISLTRVDFKARV